MDVMSCQINLCLTLGHNNFYLLFIFISFFYYIKYSAFLSLLSFPFCHSPPSCLNHLVPYLRPVTVFRIIYHLWIKSLSSVHRGLDLGPLQPLICSSVLSFRWSLQICLLGGVSLPSWENSEVGLSGYPG